MTGLVSEPPVVFVVRETRLGQLGVDDAEPGESQRPLCLGAFDGVRELLAVLVVAVIDEVEHCPVIVLDDQPWIGGVEVAVRMVANHTVRTHEVFLDSLEDRVGLLVVDHAERPDQAQLSKVVFALVRLVRKQGVQCFLPLDQLRFVEVKVGIIEGADRLEARQYGALRRGVLLFSLFPYAMIGTAPPFQRFEVARDVVQQELVLLVPGVPVDVNTVRGQFRHEVEEQPDHVELVVPPLGRELVEVRRMVPRVQEVVVLVRLATDSRQDLGPVLVKDAERGPDQAVGQIVQAEIDRAGQNVESIADPVCVVVSARRRRDHRAVGMDHRLHVAKLAVDHRSEFAISRLGHDEHLLRASCRASCRRRVVRGFRRFDRRGVENSDNCSRTKPFRDSEGGHDATRAAGTQAALGGLSSSTCRPGIGRSIGRISPSAMSKTISG